MFNNRFFPTSDELCCLGAEFVSLSKGRVAISIVHLRVGFSVYRRVRVFLS